MSIEQARQFLARVDEDDQVREAARAAYAAELLKLATKLGFQVTGEDLQKAVAELAGTADELTLDQLEAVAGGIGGNKPIFEKDSSGPYLVQGGSKLR